MLSFLRVGMAALVDLRPPPPEAEAPSAAAVLEAVVEEEAKYESGKNISNRVSSFFIVVWRITHCVGYRSHPFSAKKSDKVKENE